MSSIWPRKMEMREDVRYPDEPFGATTILLPVGSGLLMERYPKSLRRKPYKARFVSAYPGLCQKPNAPQTRALLWRLKTLPLILVSDPHYSQVVIVAKGAKNNDGGVEERSCRSLSVISSCGGSRGHSWVSHLSDGRGSTLRRTGRC